MNMELKDLFLERWHAYFGHAELPITFQYTDNGIQAEPALASVRERCVIHMLNHVREGHSLRFFARSFGCGGGKFYTGYTPHLREDIGEFLSCGIEGVLKGEHYKQTPEIAQAGVSQAPWYDAPGNHLVFKRWDKLGPEDDPEVVIFFATPDVLSGLFTLAAFDEPNLNDAAITPFGSGCASIIMYPYAERLAGRGRAVIGMFDVTARPWVNEHSLTFAVGIDKFTRMVHNMSESFLALPAWAHLYKRIRPHRIHHEKKNNTEA